MTVSTEASVGSESQDCGGLGEISDVREMTPLTGAGGPNRDTALQAIVTWATSTTFRMQVIADSRFPLGDDLPAFLLVNQLIYRGAARPTDLADAIDTGKSNVAKIARRLEGAGLVMRLPDPRDDRGVVLGLTRYGREVGERIRRSVQNSLTSTSETWSEQELETLEKLLIKLARTIDAFPHHPLQHLAGLRLP